MAKYELDQFLAVRRYLGNLTFSPDGTEVAYITDTSGRFNIWRQSVRGGWPFQVTTFDDRTVQSVVWAPSGDLYFLADQTGAEKHQVYRIPAKGGVPEQLTDDPAVTYTGLLLSRDGRSLFYAGNAIDPSRYHIFRRDLTTGETQALCGGLGYMWTPSWESPDGRFLLVSAFIKTSTSAIHLYDFQTGESQELIAPQGLGHNLPGPWAADGSGFYYVSDEGREFKALRFYNVQNQTAHIVEAPDWDVDTVTGSADGRCLLWTVNEGGYTRCYLRDLRENTLVDLPADMHEGVTYAFTLSPDGSRIAYRQSTPTRAAENMVYEVGTAEPARLTYSLLGGIDEQDLVTPELVSFPTFDRHIPGWLYKPRTVAPGSRVPAVLSVHGGPDSQELPHYNALYQHLLDQGIAILAPNIRGSTGYGKSYQRLIHRDWGGGDLKDLGACAEYLRSLPWVAPDRIAVFGGSYGGFATLQAVTRLPQYWACGVDLFGVSNLVTFTRSVPPAWKAFLKDWVGDPDEDHDMLVERSPITYVENVRCPMLVIQGAHDPRVVKAESDQMVDRLRALGREVEYIVFDDEGHGFLKRENTISGFRAISTFLRRQLQTQA